MSFPLSFIPNGEVEIYRVGTTRDYPRGLLLLTGDGRTAKFTENGGTAIGAGRLAQSEVPGANFDDIIIAAHAVGDRAITATNQGTAISANDFAEGYMVVQDDAGEGVIYVINDHAAISASVDGTINLAPPGIRIATVATTTVLLVKHPYKDVIIHPSPPTAGCVGFTTRNFPVDNFGWLQTSGPASVLGDIYTGSPVAIGRMVFPSITVDGAVGVGRATVRTGSTAAADSTSGALAEDAAGAEITGVRLMASAIDTDYNLGVVLDEPVGKILELAVDTEFSFVYTKILG